jgi:tetratricopeptide (TPR) repeat protein
VVREEPDFAPGQTALGEAVLAADEASGAPLARGLASKTLALSPQDARAHLLLGRIALSYEWDWTAAQRHLSRAIELAPRDPSAYLAQAVLLGSLARHQEAFAAAAVARELDPLSSIVLGDLAMLRFWAEDWEGVFRESGRLLELDPEAGIARSLRLEALLRQRRWEEARNLALTVFPGEKSLQAVDGPGIGPRCLAIRETRWERAAPSATRSMVLATLAAEQGRDDEAMRLLEEAVRQRSGYVPFLAVDPHFRRLASRADFGRLLARIHHPLSSSLAPSAAGGESPRRSGPPLPR